MNVKISRLVAGGLVLLAAPMAGRAAAQERQSPALEFTVGWVGFADDGIVSEALVGGQFRWYVSPRISVGPEFVYMDGDDHSHMVITGNLMWDARAPTNGRPPSVTPFVVVGGGLFQTREQFPSGPFTSNEGAFTAGGGVRALAGERVTIGADARIGWELHVRVNAFVGVRLGR